ncbi:MAG: hypothetical protein AAF485_02040 [Chloroflexota bacterium]
MGITAERIEITIDGDGQLLINELKRDGKAVDEFNKKIKKDFPAASDGAGKAADRFTASAKELGRELGAGLGLATVTKELWDFGVSAVQAADEARVVSSAFTNLSGGTAEAAANYDALARATTVAGRQLVDETTRMQIANQLLGMQIATNAGELEKVVSVSRRLGAEFRGLGAAEAADEFALMMSNMSVARLDSFGISSGRVRKRIDELMASTAGMTREQAFFTATMEEADQALARLGPELETQTQALTAVGSSWEDFRGNFGQLILDIGDASGDFDKLNQDIQDLSEGAKAWSGIIDNANTAYRIHSKVVGEMEMAWYDYVIPVRNTIVAYEEYNRALDKVQEQTRINNEQQEIHDAIARDQAAALEALAESAEDYSDAVEVSSEALAQQAENQSEANRFGYAATELFDVQIKSTEQYKQKQEELAETQAAAAEEQKQHLEQLMELERERNESLQSMLGTSADYFLGISDYYEQVNQTEAEFQTELGELRRQAAEEQNEENRAALNQRIDDLIAANEREKAEQYEHLNELRLKTALSMMEVSGDLEQFTGLVGLSAAEAVDLIQAGVIPVTDQMGQQIQQVLGDLTSANDEVATQAARNQDILGQAYAGTLEEVDKLAEGFDKAVPLGIALAEDSMTAFATTSQANIEGTSKIASDLDAMFHQTLPESIADAEVAGEGMADTLARGLTDVETEADAANTSIGALEVEATSAASAFVTEFGYAKSAVEQLEAATDTASSNMVTDLNKPKGVLSSIKSSADTAVSSIESFRNSNDELDTTRGKLDSIKSKLDEIRYAANEASNALNGVNTSGRPSAMQSSSMMTTQASGGQVIINELNLYGVNDPQQLFEAIAREAKMRGVQFMPVM